MNTNHQIIFKNARQMKAINSGTIDLVVTSPPYPMIEMWDEIFTAASPGIRSALSKNDGAAAFELMHRELDRVWDEVVRVLKNGGFACINIGDATRTINENFMLYPNHARILSALHQRGLSPLPAVIWRKQTNAPNKFMGSGVLPAGAYVTLEHEYVLILRKGGKRSFDTEKDRAHRQESALFWEERNQWFSDVWFDLKGARQDLLEKDVRKRSGAFPFELPYRLINMYSVGGDRVLDPFMGTGTTMLAAMAAGRNSVGFELDPQFAGIIENQVTGIVDYANTLIRERLARHEAFVKARTLEKGPFRYTNGPYGFPVVMNQEKNLVFHPLKTARKTENGKFEIEYAEDPGQRNFEPVETAEKPKGKKFQQMELKL
ncbi:MAG: site-specific DNA-methyltransferase [Desulfosalsimonadaceae bacterium]